MPRKTEKQPDVPFPTHATLTLKITIWDKRVLGFLAFGKAVGHLKDASVSTHEKETDVMITLEANELYIPPSS